MNLLRPQIEMMCVPSWSILNLMWHAYVRRCCKTTKDIYLYIYLWWQNSAGRTLLVSRVNVSSTVQYNQYSVDKAASWLSPARLGSVFLVLLATCSTLFPPVMPYLFFITLRSTPTHSSACQYIIPLFHFSTIFLDKSSILCLFLAQRINYWPDSTTSIFFLTFLSVLMLFCIQSFHIKLQLVTNIMMFFLITFGFINGTFSRVETCSITSCRSASSKDKCLY